MNSKIWNDVYKNKSENELSWFQAIPEKSLELINELKLKKNSSIIDIGGGDSRLTECLLAMGFKDITILDISAVALKKAKGRLEDKLNSVKYVVSDIRKFNPPQKYNLWHDRATFHFLLTNEDVEAYLKIANQSIVSGGFLIISTFSKIGPAQCSGLPVTQYSDNELKNLFEKYFTNIRCFEDIHKTPWNSSQSFVYCGFKKK